MEKLFNTFIISILVFFQSCSALNRGQFFTSNNKNKSDFYSPGDDFPVSAGDVDKSYELNENSDSKIDSITSSSNEDLNSMGFSSSRSISTVSDPKDHYRDYFRPRAFEIGQGMTKEEIMDNFGRPIRVEVAGNPSYENERWLYNVNGAMKYIYFESGHVDGWE